MDLNEPQMDLHYFQQQKELLHEQIHYFYQQQNFQMYILDLVMVHQNLVWDNSTQRQSASAVLAVKSPNNRSVGANYIRPDIPPMFWGKCDLPLQKMPFKVDLNGI